MANEVVKYNNEMNKIAFTGFSPRELNVFYTLCSIMKEKNTTEIKLTYHNLIELSGLKDSRLDETRQTKLFEDMYKNLLKLTFGFDDGDNILYFNLFNRFHLSRSKREITISANPDYAYILNNLVSNFTRFELEEFNGISGQYAKLLYRHLKQWKSTGRWEVSVKEFRRLLDVPKSYNMSDLTKRILIPSIDELDKIEDFGSIKFRKIKTGRKVEKLIFEYKPWKQEDTSKKSNWRSKNRVIIPKVNYTLDSEEKADPEEIEKVMKKLKKTRDKSS